MDTLQRKQYTEANREAWNEVMPFHQKAAREKWDLAFSQPGYSCLDDIEMQQLRKIGIQGKDIAHLCCNNGIELLSLKNLGAGRCVGFDICDEAILEATQRAEMHHIDCQFIRTDVFDINHTFDRQFDMIYISVGCLGWLPDLVSFFNIAARLLRDDGIVFIHEEHPFSEMLPNDDANQTDVLHIIDPYFKTEPYVDYGDLDYLGNTHYASQKPQYWFTHTFSDILMAMIDNHINILHLSEYDVDIANSKKRLEQANAGVPLSYILFGRKRLPR
jgi:SAM-dependent methyltransferase